MVAHSNVCIMNQCASLGLEIMCPSMNLFCSPLGRKYIPVLLALTSFIRVRPSSSFEWSEPISLQIYSDTKVTCCSSRRNVHFCVNTRSVGKTLQVVLSPPIVVRNMLPCRTHFYISDQNVSAENSKVTDAGEINEYFDYSGQESGLHIVCRLQGYAWSGETKDSSIKCLLSEKESDFRHSYNVLLRKLAMKSNSSQTNHSYVGSDYFRLRVSVAKKSSKRPYIMCDISCDYWTINKTGLPLQFMSDGIVCSMAPISRNMLEDELTSSPRCIQKSLESTLQMRVGDDSESKSRWTREFDVHIPGTHHVLSPGGYSIVCTVDNGPLAHGLGATRVLNFFPRFVFLNLTGDGILLRQLGSDDITRLEQFSGASVPDFG